MHINKLIDNENIDNVFFFRYVWKLLTTQPSLTGVSYCFLVLIYALTTVCNRLHIRILAFFWVLGRVSFLNQTKQINFVAQLKAPTPYPSQKRAKFHSCYPYQYRSFRPVLVRLFWMLVIHTDVWPGKRAGYKNGLEIIG